MAQMTHGQSTPPYLNPELSVEIRVEDLLDRMTLEEKVVQLLCIWEEKEALLDDGGRFNPGKALERIPLGIGHVARPSDRYGSGVTGEAPNRGPADTVEFVNAVQRFLIKETRLGIPALMHEEGLHGLQARDATHFPQAIALAATWDTDLVKQIYSIVAREIRIRGSHQVLSPVVDVARDPRWGRIEETYGEDPFLVAEMGKAAVLGFQGASMPLGHDKVLATLKHMTGHGQPENGTNIGPAPIAERTLREVFFPPFEAALREAGAMSVMASYNEIDGVPSHANRWLLNDVLRGEWGFDGFVVADYYAIPELQSRHHVATDKLDAARQALFAGVDVELPQRDAYPALTELVENGTIPVEWIDQSVARVLRAKFVAGLFESPFADPLLAEEVTGNLEARRLAERATEKSVILLKNDDQLLPIRKKTIRRIAVIGPNANEAILGGYSDVPRQTVSLLEGIRNRFSAEFEVYFAQGVRLTESRNWFADGVELADPEENSRLIEEAVRVARQSDIVILALGDNEQTSREAWSETHLGDRTSLDLVGDQNKLFDAILDTGVPIVTVMIHGRPLAISRIAEHSNAILDAWYPGQEGGTALARILAGDVNPGGKLPVSIPRSVGQLPVFYNFKPTARRGYLFGTTEPLFPFGFGLSYTQFAFENLRATETVFAADEQTEILVDVRNVGDIPGDEVVQCYIRDEVSSVTRPIKELKAFERIQLEPGEMRTVRFVLGPEQLSFWNREMSRVVEPGIFTIMVGADSTNLQSLQITVRG